jgi:two-component system, LytTR family, response regulator
MTKIRCIAVDDEPLALELLADYISKVPFLELVGTTGNVLDALSTIQQGKIDLVFLDILMPDLTGMQFLRLTNGKCKAIMTTAYPQYALEGYEYEVIDYLLKPISFERFMKAVQKANGYFNENAQDTSSPIHRETSTVIESIELPKPLETPEFIFVKVEHKIKKINLADILYIEGLKDYVSIYTKTERILSLQTMKKIEESLPNPRFYRVHKSYIIAVDKIDYIERQRIFIGKNNIPLSDTFREGFMKVLGSV